MAWFISEAGREKGNITVSSGLLYSMSPFSPYSEPQSLGRLQ